MPESLNFVAVLFGDGARGYKLQIHENKEFKVTCTAVREDRRSQFVRTFMSELTGDEEFSTFAALRERWNELSKK